MSYTSIMVSVDLAGHAAERIKVAAHLADDVGALLIGVAAQRPDHAAAPVGPTGASLCLLPVSPEDTKRELAKCHALFRDATQGRDRVEWRSDVASPMHYLIEQGRAADLIVLGRPPTGGSAHHDLVDPGAFVMSAGRPVLVTPPGVDYLDGQRVVIAWKDTREARRAVFDAMPLLKRAKYVNVVALQDDEQPTGAQDVARYLQGHGVQATVAEQRIAGTTTPEALLELTSECGADLIVMGAYGHGRLREWVFGGVTRDLLSGSPVCCLMSH